MRGFTGVVRPRREAGRKTRKGTLPGLGFLGRAIALAACLVALTCVLLGGAPVAAQEIIIARPARNSPFEVTKASLRFEVLISAFEKIRRVRINGKKVKFKPSLSLRLRRLIRLKPGMNRIVVEAFTKAGRAEKTFEIRYRKTLLSRLTFWNS